MATIESLDNFALGIYKLLKSDRDVNIGVGGFTGEGKSTFLVKLQKAYSRIARVPWGFATNMTWDRKELKTWIDGKSKSEKGANGLKIGQKPEYSAILVDELFSMFYKRNWQDDDQKEMLGIFNMCRDRHLFIGGNIPNFFDLDKGFLTRMRYYAYISERGVAWIFEQENNPFSFDRWNVKLNMMAFRKKNSPYKLPNFICEIHFSDFTPKEKELYYKIRNQKRLSATKQLRSSRGENYNKIKNQRDALIKLVFGMDKKLKNKDIGDLLGLSGEAIRLIRYGLR